VTGPWGAAPGRDAYLAAERLLDALGAAGQTLATCESLTGGLIGATLTSVPGASAVYRGGLITYATALKHVLAGVDPDDLARDGAVAPGTARQMAAGARERCGADWAVAVTGVAGPDEQEGHPAGTVFVAVAGPGTDAVEGLRLSGDRHGVRAGTVEAALGAVLRAVTTRVPPSTRLDPPGSLNP